jgi:ABC-type Mn2+/Zn2+ transport system ATPase subunit
LESAVERQGPLLKIEKLSVAYGRTLALREVNLELKAGQLVGIIGPNGAGKSTLLKAMLGIVPRSGRVLVGGEPLDKARDKVSYVPQREEVRWDFPVTVWDVVMMGRYRRIGWVKFATKADRDVVGAALEEVGMYQLRDRQISQLSGGQQQRVFMARALAQAGEVILLDEPLTGVDIASQEIILKLLARLTHEGKLVLMATHDLDTAAEKCQKLCCINHGLVAFGTPSEVFQPEVLARTYGGKVLTVGSAFGNPDGAKLTTMIVADDQCGHS